MQIVQRAVRFKFGTTVALFSGGPQHQKLARQVIQNIQRASKSPVSFVGVIGDQNSQHFDHVYQSSDSLFEYDFDRTRYQQEVISDSILIPYRIPTHFKNNSLVKTLLRNNLFEDLEAKKVDCLVTVGNFSLSKRIYTALNKHYKNSGRVRPPTFLFDSHIADRNVYNEQYLDFIFYRLAKHPDNMQKYIFPSMCIGYEGLFRAFQYLQQFKKDSDSSTFWSENFSYDVSELVRKARQTFRQQKGINQDHYAIVLAPGETEKQVKFTFKNVIPGINNFLQTPKIKSISNQFFEMFVILPQDVDSVYEIKSQASKLPSKFKVHFIEPQDKYGALCAGDFSILHNGQITVEAAACQLPAVVVNSMSNARAYLQYLFNGHASPLNVSTNYHAYEQLLGSTSVTTAKISYILNEHFERPKLRFYYAKLYREHIQYMLSKSDQSPLLDVSETGIEVASRHIVDTADKYRSIDHNVRRSVNQRKDALSLTHH